MKYRIKAQQLILPLILGAIVYLATRNFSMGIAIFAASLIPAMIGVYVPYANDNPEHLWFKRKLYGWGWTPVTWQGWLVTALYVGLLVLASMTIDGDSPIREIFFTFILPALFLTIAFIRIANKKGERPKWQWGRDEDTESSRNK